MDLKNYIVDKLIKSNVIEKEYARLELAVSVDNSEKKFEIYEYRDDEYVFEEYVYVYNVEIEDFGTLCDEEEEELEKNINGSNIFVDVNIKNDIIEKTKAIGANWIIDFIIFSSVIVDASLTISIPYEDIKDFNLALK